MAQLGPGERRDLVAEYVDNAKINWAHVAVSCLIGAGYVDRVLTTNFDPLIMRACAQHGIFPAVYDFAASQIFKPADIPGQAIFHLHGQRSGFVQLHTPEEIDEHSKRLEPLFQDAGRGRSWIVAGYSGDNDPVLDHLIRIPKFDYKLFWVCYRDNEPSKKVNTELLSVKLDNYALPVKGFDADGFFITLARKLGCFPPTLINDPFSFLMKSLDTLSDFPLDEETKSDITKATREQIRKCQREIKKEAKIKKKSKIKDKRDIYIELQEANSLMVAGKYEEVIAIGEAFDSPMPKKLVATVSWAYVFQGLALFDKACSAGKPNKADTLFNQAYAKYERALKFKPDMHEALNNLGLALQNQAMSKKGAEADNLFTLANGKYAAALEIKRDKHNTVYNWGTSLSHQADSKTGAEADQLYSMAYEKYTSALEIKPGMHTALYNWGTALHHQAESNTGKEADNLFTLAYEKYAAALEIKPDKHEALNNWGAALVSQAKMKTGEEADNLYQESYEKYATALEIKPDTHEAMTNWGTTLQYQAQTKTGKQAEKLFAKAKDKFLEVEESYPGRGAYSLACIEALADNDKECRRWLEVCLEHVELPTLEHINSDSDLDSVRNKKWFKDFLKTHPENTKK